MPSTTVIRATDPGLGGDALSPRGSSFRTKSPKDSTTIEHHRPCPGWSGDHQEYAGAGVEDGADVKPTGPDRVKMLLICKVR